METIVGSECSLEDGIGQIVEFCSKELPSEEWALLSALDAALEEDRIMEWLRGVFDEEAPGASVDGLWFGLFNPIYDGKASADIYVSGGKFDPDDEDWASEMAWEPKGAYAHSKLLDDVYKIAYRTSEFGLGNNAEFPICLVWAGLVLKRLARDLGPEVFLTGGAIKRAITFGFDSGNLFHLGDMGTGGFALNVETVFL